jgi:hypothetical protein
LNIIVGPSTGRNEGLVVVTRQKCYRREREEKREIYAGEMVQERGGKNQKKKIGTRRTYGTEEVTMVAGGRWNFEGGSAP